MVIERPLGCDVVDAAGVTICTVDPGLVLGKKLARRIRACVNAMAGLSTEDIERKFGEHPVEYWLRTHRDLLSEVLDGPPRLDPSAADLDACAAEQAAREATQ